MLIARWILDEEEIDENSTFAELDEIAKMVQDSLGGTLTRGETALTTASEERMSSSNEESAAAVTHPAACLRIIDCLKQVLYQQLQFKGNVNDYYKKENSMLHQVYMILHFKINFWLPVQSKSAGSQQFGYFQWNICHLLITSHHPSFDLCNLLLLAWSIFIHVGKIYANLIWNKNRVLPPQDCFATQTWLAFHYFGTPLWLPWCHAKALYPACCYKTFCLGYVSVVEPKHATLSISIWLLLCNSGFVLVH